MTNSADPDQLASSVFAKTGHVLFSKRRVNKFVLLMLICCKVTGWMANSVDPDLTDAGFWTSPFHSLIWQVLFSEQVHFTPWSDRCCFLNKSISLPDLTDAAFWTSPFHSLIWQMLLSEQVHLFPDLTDAAFWTSPFHSLIWQMLLSEQVHFTRWSDRCCFLVHFTPWSDRCCFLNKSISLPDLTDAAF